jgi:hypothetical protein
MEQNNYKFAESGITLPLGGSRRGLLGEFKKSMFNVKIISLMKKQLFSLVMMLALFVLAGTSAFAQSNGLTIATAYWHTPGSEHQITTLAATPHTGTTFAWAVASVTCAGGVPVTPSPVPTLTNETTATLTFTYPDAAAGIYRFTCTETANGCSTIREFFTAIMDINVVVIASNNLGTVINGAALTGCNDYTLRNGTNGNLVGNANIDDNTNNLNGWDSNDALFNERWVNVTLTTSEATTCPGMQALPAATSFAWQFDYTVTGTNFPSAANFIALQPATNILPAAAGAVTYTLATSTSSKITVDKGVTSFTIPLRSNIRWGTTDTDQDQEFQFTVVSNSTILDDDSTPYNYTDGREAASKNLDNISALQHIDASPATPRITPNY